MTHSASSTPHLMMESERHHSKLRTECWFERCIFEDRIVPGNDHIVYTPLEVKLPIQGELVIPIRLETHSLIYNP